jgi:hypothetical protein
VSHKYSSAAHDAIIIAPHANSCSVLGDACATQRYLHEHVMSRNTRCLTCRAAAQPGTPPQSRNRTRRCQEVIGHEKAHRSIQDSEYPIHGNLAHFVRHVELLWKIIRHHVPPLPTLNDATQALFMRTSMFRSFLQRTARRRRASDAASRMR